jgi:hypothetical protein
MLLVCFHDEIIGDAQANIITAGTGDDFVAGGAVMTASREQITTTLRRFGQ